MQTETTTIWNSPWLRPFNDLAAIDDLLGQIHPTWALGRIKARVQQRIAETPDTTTFVLRPNRNWPGFRAGQHVGVTVEIAGVRHQRRYSIASAPDRERRIEITVKRQAGGKVSNWLHDHLRGGDTVELDAPSGDFALPNPLPARLLMLSAGSGITPLMSMLRSLARERAATTIAFVHVAHTRAHAIFGRELSEIATGWDALDLHVHEATRDGRFNDALLARLVPDYTERTTLLCGPATFMADRRAHWRGRGREDRLQFESFGPPPMLVPANDTTALDVRCAGSERLFTTTGATSLLEAAERGGLRPRYGCRMGICHTCSCVKRSGTVENVLTGEISSEPGERIQLCISRARTDLTLEL